MTDPSAPQRELGGLLFPERRRPGRVEFDNPHLIALLRRPTGGAVPLITPAPPEGNAIRKEALRGISAELTEKADSLAAARGLGVWVGIGAIIGSGIALLTWWLIS